MNVVACYKVVPDAQDIQAAPGAPLDLSRAERVIGEYDLMAIEAAATLAEQTDGRAVLLSAGGPALADTKMVKAALSRGAEELFCVADDALEGADAWQSATVLAAALGKMDYDLVICGEGSSDQYAQQTGALLGSLLGVPTLNAVSAISPIEGGVRVERTLEEVVEVIDVPTPAVLSVTSDINLPRVPQLKDILAAGKKPVTSWGLDELGGLPSSATETVSVLAPEDAERKHVIYEEASDEAIAAVVAAIKAAR